MLTPRKFALESNDRAIYGTRKISINFLMTQENNA